MKKAIFFDIDGTLIDCMNGKMDISDRVKNVIKDLQKMGIMYLLLQEDHMHL